MKQKTCRVHSCYIPGFSDYDPKSCRCRKLIIAEPDPDNPDQPSRALMLAMNYAVDHVPERIPTGRFHDRTCDVCVADPVMVKSCEFCGRTGVIKSEIFRIVYSGNIVLISNAAVDDESGVRKITQQQKTTRIDCITKADIERAYVDNKPEDKAKIEQWGMSALEVLIELKAPFRDDPFEGRQLLYSPAGDERTSVGRNVYSIPEGE